MVLLKQRFALAHVNVTDLPSSQCVASAGSTEGENAERLLAEGAESMVRIDAAPQPMNAGVRAFLRGGLYIANAVTLPPDGTMPSTAGSGRPLTEMM
jgi:hypothetical protein